MAIAGIEPVDDGKAALCVDAYDAAGAGADDGPVQARLVPRPGGVVRAIELAGLLWGGAFLLFVLAYGPRLVGPRPDGRA